MNGRFGFLNPGVDRFDLENTRFVTRPAPRALSNSLVEASTEFQLILPYVLIAVAPACPFEPLAECNRFLKVPSDVRYWSVGRDLVAMGARSDEVGIRSDQVFGVPKLEWTKVSNFLRSILIVDPEHDLSWFLRLQPVRFVDPLMLKGRPLEASDVTVEAVAFALDAATSDSCAAAYLKPNKFRGDVPESFKLVLDQANGDSRLMRLCKSLQAGEDLTVQGVHCYEENTDRDCDGSVTT